ncbi:MAG: pilus assembly protein CpaE [Pseudonocardiales bacterium]|nr:pilus assembly protein CpaE [Pseudonocardiales bacterium]
MTIVCEPDVRAARVLAAAIGGEVRAVPALGEVSALLAETGARCAVVLGAGLDFEEALRFTEHLHVDHPAVKVILLRERGSTVETGRASAAGVAAVFDPAAHDQIAHACSVDGLRADGQVFTVFAAKGGCGKTMLATNLAVALRGAGERRVCLLDLDLDHGDVASVLALDTDRTLARLIAGGEVGELLDRGELVTAAPRTGLDCILAPVAPGDAERVRPARIDRLLRALTSRYDAVVVDLPARFSPAVLVALDHAHHHLVVSTPERPALKNLRQTLDILDLLGYSRAARAVLFNRSDLSAAISAADVAAVVRGPIAAHLPSSRDVAASINQGVPLMAAQPAHPVSVAIRRFADRYTPVLPTANIARAT